MPVIPVWCRWRIEPDAPRSDHVIGRPRGLRPVGVGALVRPVRVGRSVLELVVVVVVVVVVGTVTSSCSGG
ncbi:MAG: hypothetical protein KatS3mg015_2910 [Fimbriimonadales bacterium]|nr:MAG: hypothetical protein KatS3mg015_2910 [Fimbriimonadales bacterium]